MAILISAKINIKVLTVIKDKEGYYTMIKWSIHQEGITFKNMYAPNTRVLKYIKQTLTELKKQTVIVGDFNTPCSIIDNIAI